MKPQLASLVLVFALGSLLLTASAEAQQAPTFNLGFKLLADQIPDVAGLPIENEHWGANGDSLQQTTTGLMAWRKSDNWTAFTNGSTTWINGPVGVQTRLNSQRFEWEKDAPVAPPSAPPPGAGLILYQADWSGGAGDWTPANGWKAAGGMLVNDGSAQGASIMAPFQPSSANYALEAEIQVVQMPQYKLWGLVVRDGYLAGIHSWSWANVRHPFVGLVSGQRLAEGDFDPSNTWHKYRVEVTGNQLKILIDGTLWAQIADYRFESPGQVGIWNSGVQLNVKSFRVIAL